MKSIIDNINSLTGWSVNGDASIHGLNDVNTYIAGNNLNSVIFNFKSENDYIEKIYGTDVSNYNELVLWVYSLNRGKNDYKKTTDYTYKIDLGSGKEFYFPVYPYLYSINIDISDIDTIDRLRITSLEDGNDYLILSYFVVSTTVFPYDILEGLKEQVEYYIDSNITLRNVGQVSGDIGDNFVEFASDVEFLDRYFVIKIDDGVNSEIHHISSTEGNKFYFSELYDKSKLLNDYIDANVYIYYPVEFGMTQKEISLPSITMWTMAPTTEFITNELDHIIDSVQTDDTFKERQIGQYLKWDVLIDCEVKEEIELLGELSEIVRKVIGQKVIWINGYKCNMYFTGPSIEIQASEAYDILPKVQYPINVSIREELYSRKLLPKTTTLNFDSEIIEQGGL